MTFTPPTPPDLPPELQDELRYGEHFLDDADELLARFAEGFIWDARMRARKTASFGVPYNYSGLTYEPVEFPRELEVLRCAVGEAVGFEPNNCLANLYEDGDAQMGFHRDDVENLALTSAIAIVSLGGPRTFALKSRERSDERHHTLVLETGSLLVMSLAMQARWLHAIPKAPQAAPRISLTFRRVEAHFARD